MTARRTRLARWLVRLFPVDMREAHGRELEQTLTDGRRDRSDSAPGAFAYWLRASLDVKGIWTNYRLMQVWDLLGLYFGCQEPYEDFVDPVPVSYASGDDDGVRMAMKPVGPWRVEFAPYPFDLRPLRVQLTLKRLSQSTFPDVEAFRRAWFGAEVSVEEFALV